MEEGLSFIFSYIFILVCCAAGIAFAIYNLIKVNITNKDSQNSNYRSKGLPYEFERKRGW